MKNKTNHEGIADIPSNPDIIPLNQLSAIIDPDIAREILKLTGTNNLARGLQLMLDLDEVVRKKNKQGFTLKLLKKGQSDGQ